MDFSKEMRIPDIRPDASGISFVALDRILDERLASDPRLAGDLAARGRGCLRFGRAMTDTQLLDKLRSFGFDLDKKTFAEMRPRFLSAEEMSNRIAADCKGKLDDNDWLWICIAVLWERWFPDAPSFEMIDDVMQNGYALSGKGDENKAVQIWLALWKTITGVMTARGMKTLDEFDRRFRGSQAVSNWVQDVETALLNECWGTGSCCTERIRFCEEVIERTADDSSLMIDNMRRGIADSYVRMGDMRQVDVLFNGWLRADPAWGWGWIGWSDGYALFTNGEKNYVRAEEILKQGLAVHGLRDKGELLDRLMRLYEETGRNDEARRIRERIEQEETALSPPLPSSRKKVGRNEPCPCGSGKKFKKCCGG